MKRIIVPMICVLVIALAFSEQLLSSAQAASPPVKGAIAVKCLTQTYHFHMHDVTPPPGWSWTGGSQMKQYHVTGRSVGSDGRTLTCKYGDHPMSPYLRQIFKKGFVCETGHPGATFWCWDKNIPSPKKRIKPRRR